jgi:exosortase F-associated protein
VDKDKLLRFATLGVSAAGLVIIFLFQEIDVAGQLGVGEKSIHRFLVNRTFRFILNDVFAIGVIYGLFRERKYVIFSVWVQVFGMVVFLLPYFALKLYYPSYNGPLISYLHRLILNPTLLLLLIPAFYFQKVSRHQAPNP